MHTKIASIWSIDGGTYKNNQVELRNFIDTEKQALVLIWLREPGRLFCEPLHNVYFNIKLLIYYIK